jgi:hypothetical protein
MSEPISVGPSLILQEAAELQYTANCALEGMHALDIGGDCRAKGSGGEQRSQARDKELEEGASYGSREIGL